MFGVGIQPFSENQLSEPKLETTEPEAFCWRCLFRLFPCVHYDELEQMSERRSLEIQRTDR